MSKNCVETGKWQNWHFLILGFGYDFMLSYSHHAPVTFFFPLAQALHCRYSGCCSGLNVHNVDPVPILHTMFGPKKLLRAGTTCA